MNVCLIDEDISDPDSICVVCEKRGEQKIGTEPCCLHFRHLRQRTSDRALQHENDEMPIITQPNGCFQQTLLLPLLCFQTLPACSKDQHQQERPESGNHLHPLSIGSYLVVPPQHRPASIFQGCLQVDNHSPPICTEKHVTNWGLEQSLMWKRGQITRMQVGLSSNERIAK